MLIRIMKEEALQTLKQSLPSIFSMYYNNADNSWMWNVCGGDPFIDFKEIPDFELMPVDLPKGEIDIENCKILYENLQFLNESQAIDERLWAGLCNDLFYGYLRKRWGMNGSKKNIKREKAIGEIQSRFFFKGGKKAGLYRNSLSKYWWVGHNTYDPITKFKKLDLLGSKDIITKINEIFHNYNFSANPVILKGICEGVGYFNDEDIKISAAEHIRPALQYINAIGGSTILDCWSSDEIKDLFINQVYNVINNNNQIELNDDENDNTLYIDMDEEISADNQTNENISEREIRFGDKVTVDNLTKNTTKIYKIEYYEGKLPEFISKLLNHKIGDIIEFGDCGYKIMDIKNK